VNKTDQIEINCSVTVKNILLEALENYTVINSPENPSLKKTCEDVKLFDFNYIKLKFNPDDNSPGLINADLHDYCHEAINLHYDHIQQKLNTTFDEQRKLMLNMLKGTPTHDSHLDCALQKDNII